MKIEEIKKGTKVKVADGVNVESRMTKENNFTKELKTVAEQFDCSIADAFKKVVDGFTVLLHELDANNKDLLSSNSMLERIEQGEIKDLDDDEIKELMADIENYKKLATNSEVIVMVNDNDVSTIPVEYLDLLEIVEEGTEPLETLTAADGKLAKDMYTHKRVNTAIEQMLPLRLLLGGAPSDIEAEADEYGSTLETNKLYMIDESDMTVFGDDLSYDSENEEGLPTTLSGKVLLVGVIGEGTGLAHVYSTFGHGLVMATKLKEIK